MASIDQLLGEGGRGLSKEAGIDTIKDLFDATADDLMEIHAKMTALMVALDAEGGLGGGYVAGLTPDAMTLSKG